MNLTSTAVFEEQCIVDFGRVFYYKGRVFRAIYNESAAKLYKDLIESGVLKDTFKKGLIRTWIAEDIQIDNAFLVLEHERIHFFLHYGEMTDQMFQEAAIAFVQILKSLLGKGLILKDAHPRNITFHKGSPVFFDFASIIAAEELTTSWLDEFYLTFAVPLKLAKSRLNHVASNYRKQHRYGVGYDLARTKLVKQFFFKEYTRWKNMEADTRKLIDNLDVWVSKSIPKIKKGSWDDYGQHHDASYEKPKTPKQLFVFDVLNKFRPETVVDFACNKGYYSYMAEFLGASVIGFDYEQSSVNLAYLNAKGKNLTFCQMDFTLPTPNFAWGLIGPNAFERFNSDIGLALGLIHHLCLIQRFPVKLFCDTCAKYAKKGVILEFVFPQDVHIKNWDIEYPKDYCIDAIKGYFKTHYRYVIESELFQHNQIARSLLFFHN